MKYLWLFTICLLSILSNAQKQDYKVNSYLEKGVKAPNKHHIGDAWLNFLVKADKGFNQNVTQATFRANSTLDWHKHSTPQIIIVIDGKGYYQEKGQKPILIKEGDVIKCEKDTEHWHTSSKTSSISYLAVYGSQPTIWTEKLTQEYYDKVSEKLEN